jgi:hypothetical protein
VPPGHEKHWSKHCGKYGACGQPVYFVREDWYQAHYVPRYANQPHESHGQGHDHDSGPGKGKGNGNGKGRGD